MARRTKPAVSEADRRWLEQHRNEIEEEVKTVFTDPPRVQGKRLIPASTAEKIAIKDAAGRRVCASGDEIISFYGLAPDEDCEDYYDSDEDSHREIEQLHRAQEENLKEEAGRFQRFIRHYKDKGDLGKVAQLKMQLKEIKARINELRRPDNEWRLTRRQKEILELGREGLSQARIAQRLGITASMVSKSVRRIREIYPDVGNRTFGYSSVAKPSQAASLLQKRNVNLTPRRRPKSTEPA